MPLNNVEQYVGVNGLLSKEDRPNRTTNGVILEFAILGHLVQYFENLLHPSKILCREVSVKEEAREPNLISFIRKQIRVHPWLIPLEISGELRQNAGMRRMTQVGATLSFLSFGPRWDMHVIAVSRKSGKRMTGRR